MYLGSPKKQGGREELEKNISRKKWLTFSKFDINKPTDPGKATPWTVACQAPLSMRFSRQEYWSGWPFPSPGDLPNPGIKPVP